MNISPAFCLFFRVTFRVIEISIRTVPAYGFHKIANKFDNLTE